MYIDNIVTLRYNMTIKYIGKRKKDCYYIRHYGWQKRIPKFNIEWRLK